MSSRNRARYIVTFAEKPGSDLAETRTAYLDRAVNHLVKGDVVAVRHVRRKGILTLVDPSTVLLGAADARAVRRWLRDAKAVGVQITVDARLQPPDRGSRFSFKTGRTKPRPTKVPHARKRQPSPPPRFNPPGGPFKREATELTVLVPGLGRLAVTDEALYLPGGFHRQKQLTSKVH